MYLIKVYGINVNYLLQKCDVIVENFKLEIFYIVVFILVDGRNKCCCLKFCLKILFCYIVKLYIGGMEKYSCLFLNDFQFLDDFSVCDVFKKIFFLKNFFYLI